MGLWGTIKDKSHLGTVKDIGNSLSGKNQSDKAKKKQDELENDALNEYNAYSDSYYYDDADMAPGETETSANSDPSASARAQPPKGTMTSVNSDQFASALAQHPEGFKKKKAMNDELARRRSFDDMERAIVDEQASGKAASVSRYDETTSTPMRKLYQASIQGHMNNSVGGSLGGTASRAVSNNIDQGMNTADNEMYYTAQNMAGGMKKSALENLQAASAGRANTYVTKAQNVQADPAPANAVSNGIKVWKNVLGLFK